MEQLFVKKYDYETKKLRFTGIKERESVTTADVFRKAKKGDQGRIHHSSKTKLSEEDKNLSSGFQTELDLIFEKNASEQFKFFYHKCWSLCRSLPEILHYKSQILDLITSTALSDRCLADTKIDLLYLIGVLARDLRIDLVESNSDGSSQNYLQTIISKVLSLVDPLSPRVTESVFQCLSYLLLYCVSVRDSQNAATADTMRQFYGTFLGHQKDFVRRLAAEAFGGLFRKCKKLKAKRSHIVSYLQTFLGML